MKPKKNELAWDYIERTVVEMDPKLIKHLLDSEKIRKLEDFDITSGDCSHCLISRTRGDIWGNISLFRYVMNRFHNIDEHCSIPSYEQDKIITSLSKSYISIDEQFSGKKPYIQTSYKKSDDGRAILSRFTITIEPARNWGNYTDFNNFDEWGLVNPLGMLPNSIRNLDEVAGRKIIKELPDYEAKAWGIVNKSGFPDFIKAFQKKFG